MQSHANGSVFIIIRQLENIDQHFKYFHFSLEIPLLKTLPIKNNWLSMQNIYMYKMYVHCSILNFLF